MKIFILVTFLAAAFAIPLEDKTERATSTEDGVLFGFNSNEAQPKPFEKNILVNDPIESEPEDLSLYDRQADEIIDIIIHPDPRKLQKGPITKEIVQAAINKVMRTSTNEGPWKQSLPQVGELQRRQILQQLQFLQKEQYMQDKQKTQQQQMDDEEQLLLKQHFQQQRNLQKQQLIEQQQMQQKKQLLEEKHQLELKEMFEKQEQMLQDHQLQWDQLRERVQLARPSLDVMRAVEMAARSNQANREQKWRNVNHRWSSNLSPELAFKPYMQLID